MKKTAWSFIITISLVGTCACTNEEEPAAVIDNVAQTSRKAYVDPETGELTSQPPTDAVLTNSAVKTPENLPPLQQEYRADGSVKIDLKGRFNTPLVAETGADGSVDVRHKEANPDHRVEGSHTSDRK